MAKHPLSRPNFKRPMDRPLLFRRLPRWVALLAGIPVLAALGLAGLAWQRGDVWKARAVEAVNAQLQGELQVEAIALSWWHGFPDISVDLTQVLAMSTEGDTLLRADRVGLELDLWSVLGDTPEVGSIHVVQGQIDLTQDAQGRWNLSSLRADSPAPESTTLTVGDVRLDDIQVSVAMHDGPRGSAKVTHATVAWPDGKAVQWDVTASDTRMDGQEMPELLPFDMSSEGTWTPGDERAWSAQGGLVVGGLESRWTGSGRGQELERGAISIASLSQRAIEGIWVEPPWEGKVALDHRVNLEATWTDGRIDATWSTTEDAFQVAPAWTGLTMAVQGMCAAKGTMAYAKGQWQWTADELRAQGSGWSLDGALRPLSSTHLEWNGSATLDASTPFDAWFPRVPHELQSVLPVSGQMHARGQLHYDTARGLRSLNGTLSLRQLMGKVDGLPYQLDAPHVQVTTDQLSADSVAFAWAGNVGDGAVEGLTWRTFSQGGALQGRVDVDAESVAIDPILQWWSHLELEVADEAQLLPRGSDLEVRIQSATLDWAALNCTDFVASTKLSHNRCTIRSASVEGLEGKAHVEGSLAPGRAGWVLSLRGSADDVSLPKLFSTYGNFGQSLIRHDHLGGAISTAGTLGLSWGLDGSWHAEHVTASLQTSLQHGRLTQLEVFDDIADYLQSHRLMAPLVDPDDLRARLRDVAFEPVSQRIDVRGEEVWLPMTVIESSAMNVAIEGSYDFDSNIDYTLGFALRDLRAGASDAFGEMEDDGLGNQFFLRMFGEVEAPEYEYDRDAAKAHRRAAIEAEKTRLREALRQRHDPASTAPQSTPQASTPMTPPSASTQPTPTPASADEVKPASETPDEEGRPSLLNRRRKPKDKGRDDLFNPDDDDYL